MPPPLGPKTGLALRGVRRKATAAEPEIRWGAGGPRAVPVPCARGRATSNSESPSTPDSRIYSVQRRVSAARVGPVLRWWRR